MFSNNNKAECETSEEKFERMKAKSLDSVDKIVAKEFTIDPNEIKESERNKVEFKLKSRDEHMKSLTDPDVEFDLLIVGGGANGTGVALDASSRGLKVAVIDSHDFAGGTSSKSTKMAHGGIRYF